MAQAADYKVEFPYGATDGEYYYTPTPSHPKTSKWLANYHRGDDRYTPTGTPIIVNGIQIGLTGATGAVSGPHLHTGRFVNGADTNPNGGGFTLKAPVKVLTVGYDSTNGNYVRLVDGDGVQWVYLHLSKQSVTVGQVLKASAQGDDMIPDKEHLDALFLRFRNRYPTAGEYEKFVGKETYNNLIPTLNQGAEADELSQTVKIGALARRDNWEQQINDGLKLIADLKKQLESSGKIVTKQTVLDYLNANLK